MATCLGRRTSALTAALLLCAPIVLGAQRQTASLVGLVRDSAGHPIPGVEVRLKGGTSLAYTDDAGGFRLGSLPIGPGNIAVRRLGFVPASVVVTLREGRTDSLVVAMTTLAASLPGVLVEDEYMERSHRILAGFWERRARGFGNFVTRDEIEKRDPHEFVDILRMTPSVNIQTRNGRKVIRFNRSPADCPPQYWVDGLRIENGSPDEFNPEDVEALEVYSGPATLPPQFGQRVWSHTCGAIVIWTRIPG
jgi:hypothetical protein